MLTLRCVRFLTRGLAGAAVIAAITAAAQPTAAPTTAAPTTAAPTTSTTPAAAAPETCSATERGTVTGCPRPVPAAAQPAGSRNKTTLTRPVTDPASMVDTRTWTSSGGNTFPGADVPFGMVQWSPDTMPHRSDGGGYTYGDRRLYGYSLTHLSGPGCRAAGDVPILPVTGSLPAGDPTDVTTSFTNKNEVARAGYYAATSNLPHPVRSQFTATPHAAAGRFTFPRGQDAGFLIKLDGSQLGDSAAKVIIASDREVTGAVTSGGFCGESDRDGRQHYTVYFDLYFNHPFTEHSVLRDQGDRRPDAAFVDFGARGARVIEAHVAISYVSVANAKRDRHKEIPGWDFNFVRHQAQRRWNELLRHIQVSGGSYARTQEFYSLLYKSFLQPNITSDVNGQYRGSDGKVHHLSNGQRDQYSNFSGWDIYHSLAQLQAMLDPGAASDMAQSLVNSYAQNGILPQWGYLNIDNYVMTGDPSDSVIADYYAFGARHFAAAQALRDMLRQATTVNRVRPGEALEARYGYLPVRARYGCCSLRDPVSAMLEYDTADFALSRFAAALGNAAAAARLQQRASDWSHVFQRSTRLLVARQRSGSFLTGVTPLTRRYYTEGDAEEYLWDVPNDYAGLIARLGGARRAAGGLRRYLAKPNAGGRYALVSNEFDDGEQFAPDYARDPAGTQLAVATIRATVYRPGPDGISNNDDLGAESSQFVWEMLGLYPENPGSDTLVFASPGFPETRISLPDGKTITISAPGASRQRFYVRSLRIDGQPDGKLYAAFTDLAADGATLDWTLSRAPTAWGSAASDAPPSYPATAAPSRRG